jgi:DhnA family fructose-bisphosphate aldolase class Ia
MRSPEIIAAGARIAAETGADVVKTFYTGDPDSMRKVVDYAMVPVVILGGSKKDSVRDLYQQVYDAVILAGCAGVAIGNNIWRDPDPAGITRGLAAIIHGGASVDEALEQAGQLVAS